jgi:hypothetical protein
LTDLNLLLPHFDQLASSALDSGLSQKLDLAETLHAYEIADTAFDAGSYEEDTPVLHHKALSPAEAI